MTWGARHNSLRVLLDKLKKYTMRWRGGTYLVFEPLFEALKFAPPHPTWRLPAHPRPVDESVAKEPGCLEELLDGG